MKQQPENMKVLLPIKILLSDDDNDDRFFFENALNAIPIQTHLVSVDNGEALLAYLLQHTGNLPDVLFMDQNMPRKNGTECLLAIKSNQTLKHLPVIIYSNAVYENVADLLYENGAHYYFKKTGLAELQQTLHKLLSMIADNRFHRPSREAFLLDVVAA